MKNLWLVLLFIPFLSFGQLSKKERKSIDKYAVEMCECVNELMGSLHPMTIQVVTMLAEDEEAGLDALRVMITEMSTQEQSKFLDSFTKMEDPSFLRQVEACDKSADLAAELKNQIDNAKGDAHQYLMEVLSDKGECKTMKALYDMGTAVE